MSEFVAAESFLARTMRRRAFLRVAGATAATSALVLAGCGTDDPKPVTVTAPVISLVAGDLGLLNYLYLLEQLEAAFYQKVLDSPPADLRPGEKEALTDLRDHEVIHREFFSYVLDTDAIASQTFDFSTVNFTTRAGVLAAAMQLEDLGVAAYAGAGKILVSRGLLNLLVKISSVEARHAAFIRDAIQPNSLGTSDAAIIATSGDFTGLNVALTPPQVLAAAAPFFTFTVDASLLATS